MTEALPGLGGAFLLPDAMLPARHGSVPNNTMEQNKGFTDTLGFYSPYIRLVIS